MMVLVCYDVNVCSDGGAKRLRNVAKICKNYGQRVQYSVFECVVTPADFLFLKNRLKNAIDDRADSLRFYKMGKNWQESLETIGNITTYDPEKDTLMF